MGRIIVSAAHGGIEGGSRDPGAVVDGVTEAREMILLRDLIVQTLRSRNYEALAVPDDLSLQQTLDWVNNRAAVGDIALEIHANAFSDTTTRGIAVFYLANNEERKSQAELLLQTYIRRVPQMPSRGAKPDTQTALGNLAFCRQVVIPSLLMEVGLLTNADDRRLLQTQRQEIALGIAEGLATWSLGRSPNPAPSPLPLPAPTPGLYPDCNINLNGGIFDQRGIIVEGNAYIPLDFVDQLGIDLPLSYRRITYQNIVFIRAVDLRDFNISVTWDGNTRTVSLRSALSICGDQIDRIMGHGNTSLVQLITFLKSKNPDALNRFPDLPKFYREEGNAEGVNFDIAFAQMGLETNFLRFGGIVKPEQNNFAGLGGVGTGAGGATFPSARLGVRAHIQHLKAYASTEPLRQAEVDPRFRFVRRGIAPLLDQLSGRWTADPQYGTKILNGVRQLYEFTGLL
ncbi:MAG: cell wall hydrolase [Leptolyngbyaceae cyanobacterium CSU_1_4]|nr:cell wall hydrolase [Leptolyngbyaceae cyanobacterium CSU_1_4]